MRAILFNRRLLAERVEKQGGSTQAANNLRMMMPPHFKISKQSVDNWIKGVSDPSTKFLPYLRVYCGVDRIDDLFEELPS